MSWKKHIWPKIGESPMQSLLKEAEPRGILLLKSLDEEIVEGLERIKRDISHLLDEMGKSKRSVGDGLKNIAEQVVKLEDTLTAKQAQLFNSLQEVRSKVTHLETGFKKLNQEIKERDRIIKLLEEQTDRLQKEFVFNYLIKPGVATLIQIRDDLLDRLEHIDSRDKREAKFLSNLDQHFLEALSEFDIEQVATQDGDFDPKFQEVISTKPTTDPRKVNSVLEVIRPGYKWREVVLRPEGVKIAKFDGGDSDGDHYRN